LLLRLVFLLALVGLAVAAFITLRHFGVAVAFIVIFTYLSVLIIVMAIILNHPRLPRQPQFNDFADELDAQGLLVPTSFRADRAFRVDEFSQEGPHYFLELDAGGVLHLSGRYLYDYEPLNGLPRRFPCTQFTVRRHAEVGYVVDLICCGLVIEPEVEAPPYSAQDFDLYRVPADGVILDNLTFDQLRQQRTAFKH
jgi:hypothetical protein